MSTVEYRWEFSRLRVKDAPGTPQSIVSAEVTVSAWLDGLVGTYSREVRLGDPNPDNFEPIPTTPEEADEFREKLKAWCLSSIGCTAEDLETLALAALTVNRLEAAEITLPARTPPGPDAPEEQGDE